MLHSGTELDIPSQGAAKECECTLSTGVSYTKVMNGMMSIGPQLIVRGEKPCEREWHVTSEVHPNLMLITNVPFPCFCDKGTCQNLEQFQYNVFQLFP